MDTYISKETQRICPGQDGVRKEDKDAKGSRAANAATSSLWGWKTLFHGPDLPMVGSQPHPEPVWKVTKADTISFLVVCVTLELLVCKSP